MANKPQRFPIHTPLDFIPVYIVNWEKNRYFMDQQKKREAYQLKSLAYNRAITSSLHQDERVRDGDILYKPSKMLPSLSLFLTNMLLLIRKHSEDLTIKSSIAYPIAQGMASLTLLHYCNSPCLFCRSF